MPWTDIASLLVFGAGMSMNDDILKPVLGKNCVLFLDDICTFNASFEEYLATTKQVLQLLRQAGMKLYMKKCMFALSEVTFLGNRLGKHGFSPSQEHVRAIIDMPAKTQLRTDASGIGLGAVLLQKHDDVFRPVCYASRKLQGAEFNYSIADLEALAIMMAVTKFEDYLIQLEHPFTIVTDNQALVFMTSKKLTSARLMRYVIRLQEFNFKVQYKQGRLNKDADALSRLRL